jgi:hypothetical protein
MKKILIPFLFLGGLLSAAPVNVSFVDGGYYGYGPYTINVNGANVQAMCMDDFLEVGGSWTANKTVVNSSDLSNTYMEAQNFLGGSTRTINNSTYTASQVYTAEAYLFNQLIQPQADRVNIQKAAWAIMDPSSLQDAANDHTIQTYITTAFNNLNFDTKYFAILSQTGVYSDQNNQEFMVSNTPEPASLALFGSGILAFGFTLFLRRRKEGVA